MRHPVVITGHTRKIRHFIKIRLVYCCGVNMDGCASRSIASTVDDAWSSQGVTTNHTELLCFSFWILVIFQNIVHRWLIMCGDNDRKNRWELYFG